ncbi:MAG TPA: phosphonate ABC transporter, permease protein PhnE [Alphaproteobacteria bacterium]|nr:phosphonate ABC transporter, permease protein PhnE [Alphaproteobacteria bacterium]
MRESPVQIWSSWPTLEAPRWRPATLVSLLLAGGVIAGSWRIAEIDPVLLLGEQGRRHMWAFLTGLFPPDLSPAFLRLLVTPIVETVQISVMGTVLAILLGFPLALLATDRLRFAGVLYEMDGTTSRLRRIIRRAVYHGARMVLNLCRAIPDVVWALMFVRVVGLGPFPGVLAIGVSYGGMLGKIYAEILESSPEGPIEALHAAGAGNLAILTYGFLPQVVANLVSYSLYRWECAIRSAAILGLVGAGGLGQQIELSMRMFQYHETSTILIIVFVLVTGVDHLSAMIRRTLPGAEG